MKILITCNNVIPAIKYGGTERVIWYLGKELVKMGHQVTFLAKKGSKCTFAKIVYLDENPNIYSHLIPKDIDVVHINHTKCPNLKIPYIFTIHGNINSEIPLDQNSVFVSENHASRYQSNQFVYNGLDWDDYGVPELNKKRKNFHFLGNAAWRVKNVKGAIETILKTPSEKLDVLGGNRLNFSMGFRFTLSPRIQFYGQCDNIEKAKIMQESKGLVFPVKWHEPFGLALIESLYYGCPVFGTPYGSLPELIKPEFGFLSNNSNELCKELLDFEKYDKNKCHQYVQDCFNSKIMALMYLEKYEQVLNNKPLNDKNPQGNL